MPRQLVPRWRTWRTTAGLGESVGSTRGGRVLRVMDDERALSQFEARPNAGRAAELLTMALLYQYHDKKINAIASDFLNYQRPLLRDVAAAAIADPGRQGRPAETMEDRDSRGMIALLKVVLARDPRNALRWADLAREYTVLAQPTKATEAIRIGLQLAPENRFLLRSTAALYVHIGDTEAALRILETAPMLKYDPWVLAPYVAISDLADHKSHYHRVAVRLLQDRNIGPRDLAELAAALGTSELNAGGGRRGRQLLRQSVEDPTENSLAQVEWMSARLHVRLIGDMASGVPLDFEARARRAAYEGLWEGAVSFSSQWLLDQPFSMPAACFGSYCASMSEDWGSTVHLANVGLRSNPGDPILLNNRAVALVELGKIRDAVKDLSDCRRAQTRLRDRAVLIATEGLLFFRIGMIEEGRRRYDKVITFFEDRHEVDIAARAALMLAREEILANTIEAGSSVKRADALTRSNPPADVQTLRKRIGSLSREAGTAAVIAPKSVEPYLEPLLDIPVMS